MAVIRIALKSYHNLRYIDKINHEKAFTKVNIIISSWIIVFIVCQSFARGDAVNWFKIVFLQSHIQVIS